MKRQPTTHAGGLATPATGAKPAISELGGALGLARVQLALQHLACGVARQLIEELEFAWCLVGSEVRLDVRLQLLCGNLGPVRDDDEGLQPLAELRVIDSDHGNLDDGGVVGEQVLDLAREDVLATGDDHLVVAPVDEEPAVSVEVADVAAAKQTVDRLLATAARVTLERHLIADEDPPHLAR